MNRRRSPAARSVHAALRAAETDLAEAGIESPRLDAELLLAHVRQTGRARLLAELHEALDADEEARFSALLTRRLAREPIAYILGSAWFHGLEFAVSPAVLIPRPETELLVGWALAWIRGRPDDLRVIDVGTGSGAIALALANALRPAPAEAPTRSGSMDRPPRSPEGPPRGGGPSRAVQIHASDISAAALEVARRNARRFGLSSALRFVEADLLPEQPRRFDLVLANLPYVGLEDRARVMEDVDRYEPHLALYSGANGLGHIERLIDGLRGRLAPGAAIALEIGDRQGPALLERLSRAFPEAELRLHPDLAGLDRLVTAEHLAAEQLTAEHLAASARAPADADAGRLRGSAGPAVPASGPAHDRPAHDRPAHDRPAHD